MQRYSYWVAIGYVSEVDREKDSEKGKRQMNLNSVEYDTPSPLLLLPSVDKLTRYVR